MNKQIYAIAGIFIMIVLVWQMVNIVHGQDMQQQLLMSHCIKHNDSHLVVIDLTCDMPLDAVVYYSNQGYQIKTILLNTLMYMQK
jgi:hypothetical protein